MERRRLMFMGLIGALTATTGLAATAKAGTLGDTAGLGRRTSGSAEAESPAEVAEQEEGGVQLAQYYSSGRFRRGPRCWNETRTVRYRDRWGRVRHRTVTQRVCR